MIASAQDAETGNNQMPWFALQVRTRVERSVALNLQLQGYEWLLPTYKARRRWSDRIKDVELPLFPGYLFCRFDPEQRFPIVKTPGVIQVVGIGKKPVPVNEAEISAIQTIVRSGLPRQPWPYLILGERVRIEEGALRGLEGILLSLKGQHRIVVSVTLLQRAVALEISREWVCPVRPQAETHLGALAAWPAAREAIC